jgi:hypothetical protein
MLWRILADTHEQRIGIMFIHFSVVPSVAEGTSSPLAIGMRSFASLQGGVYSARDDNSAHLQPTTSVSDTKVLPGGLRPPAIAKAVAEIAGIAEMGPPAIR